jgi:hypothetical protein
MLRVQESLAYHVLRDMKIEYDKVLNVVRGALPSEPTPPKTRELSPETKRLLESSLQVARQRGDQDIRSEHLLLALVKGEDKSIRYVMRQINLEPNVVRSCVERVLEEGFPPPADEQEATIKTTSTAMMMKQTDPTNRAKVLQLVETGKISASEGAELLKAMRFSAIPVPGSGGFVLLPLEEVNFDELRQRSLHLTVTEDGSSEVKAELTIPFEQAQSLLFKLLRDMYGGAQGKLIELNGGQDHLHISME